MSLTFNTIVLDVSVALNAINHYQAGKYKEAIEALQCVLDLEPHNWDARLMLAACYYKTAQYVSASRAFQYIVDCTDNADVRKKAQEGAQVSAAKMNKRDFTEIPPEFGCHVEMLQKTQPKTMSWL